MPAKMSKMHQRVRDAHKHALGMAAFTGQLPAGLDSKARKNFNREMRRTGMRIPKNNFWDETREYSDKIREQTQEIVLQFVQWLHPRVSHPEVQAHLDTRPDSDTVANLIRAYDADEAALTAKFEEIGARHADKFGAVTTIGDVQLQMNIMTTYEELINSYSGLMAGTQAELFARLSEYDHLFKVQQPEQEDSALTDEQNPDIVTDVVVH